jgi:hypothetical protein
MQTQANHISARERRGQPKHSCKRSFGFAIVYVVALFDIAGAMAPASAALHSDPPAGMRQCFRTVFGGKETKKLATALPVIEQGFAGSAGRSGR